MIEQDPDVKCSVVALQVPWEQREPGGGETAVARGHVELVA